MSQGKGIQKPDLTELFNAILEGTTDAVFVKDTAGKYLIINSAGADFLGKSIDDIIGQDDTYRFVDSRGRVVHEVQRDTLGGTVRWGHQVGNRILLGLTDNKYFAFTLGSK